MSGSDSSRNELKVVSSPRIGGIGSFSADSILRGASAPVLNAASHQEIDLAAAATSSIDGSLVELVSKAMSFEMSKGDMSFFRRRIDTRKFGNLLRSMYAFRYDFDAESFNFVASSLSYDSFHPYVLQGFFEVDNDHMKYTLTDKGLAAFFMLLDRYGCAVDEEGFKRLIDRNAREALIGSKVKGYLYGGEVMFDRGGGKVLMLEEGFGAISLKMEDTLFFEQPKQSSAKISADADKRLLDLFAPGSEHTIYDPASWSVANKATDTADSMLAEKSEKPLRPSLNGISSMSYPIETPHGLIAATSRMSCSKAFYFAVDVSSALHRQTEGREGGEMPRIVMSKDDVDKASKAVAELLALRGQGKARFLEDFLHNPFSANSFLRISYGHDVEKLVKEMLIPVGFMVGKRVVSASYAFVGPYIGDKRVVEDPEMREIVPRGVMLDETLPLLIRVAKQQRCEQHS